ncbi:MAG: hypothetical protein HY823_04470 [Acidobacteria bacterium]|nr:hypothetical protein [Acidobacteriota bacterium]
MAPLLCFLSIFQIAPALGPGSVPHEGPALVSQVPAAPDSFPSSRSFLDEGRPTLDLAGTEIRIRNGIPFYTLAFYVNLKELRGAAGPGPWTLDRLAGILVGARVSQAYVTRFHQPVGRERRMEFLLENLRRYWDGPGFREDTPAMRQFLAFFDWPLERNAETVVWLRAGVIYTRRPGQKATGTRDPGICRAFSASYLSALPKPGADAPMRDALLKDLPGLLARDAQPRR